MQVEHNPLDVDHHFPMADMPFWKWLTENSGASGYFLNDLRKYLSVPEGLTVWITTDQMTAYKATYEHFWWLKVRERSQGEST